LKRGTPQFVMGNMLAGVFGERRKKQRQKSKKKSRVKRESLAAHLKRLCRKGKEKKLTPEDLESIGRIRSKEPQKRRLKAKQKPKKKLYPLIPKENLWGNPANAGRKLKGREKSKSRRVQGARKGPAKDNPFTPACNEGNHRGSYLGR